MEVVFEDLNMDLVDAERAGAFVERFAEAAQTDDVTLVFAGDFEASVRRRADEDYTAARSFGAATAKTLTSLDPVCVVVSAWVCDADLDDDLMLDAHRTATHEGFHVRLHATGQSTNDLRVSRGLSEWTHDGFFVAAAGIAAEEYRVETAVHELHDDRAIPFAESVRDTLAGFRAELLDAITMRSEDESIERTCRTALGAFHQTSVFAAYLLAEPGSSGDRLRRLAAADWDRFVGDMWPELVETFGRLRPASVVMDRDEIEGAVDAIAEVFDRWLLKVGFSLRDIEPSGLYFNVESHDF